MANEIAWKESRFLNVPLTDEEVMARGEQLADLIGEADALRAEHKKQKEGMKDAEESVEGRIRHLAGVVNARVEERSVQVEVRYSALLHLVEEVRIDTGEVVKTRQPTEDDKVRASIQAQTSLPGITEPKEGA